MNLENKDKKTSYYLYRRSINVGEPQDILLYKDGDNYIGIYDNTNYTIELTSFIDNNEYNLKQLSDEEYNTYINNLEKEIIESNFLFAPDLFMLATSITKNSNTTSLLSNSNSSLDNSINTNLISNTFSQTYSQDDIIQASNILQKVSSDKSCIIPKIEPPLKDYSFRSVVKYIKTNFYYKNSII